MSERAAPQYCPYCGDEDLRPEVLSEDKPEASHGVWLCRACARVFKLSFVGISARVGVGAGVGVGGGASAGGGARTTGTHTTATNTTGARVTAIHATERTVAHS